MDSKTCSDGNQKPGPQTSLESAELLCHQTKPNESCKSSRFTRVDGPWSWIVVVFLLFCILFQYGCTSTYGILFPDILRGLKSSRALAAIPGSAAVSNTGILGIFIGKLCDQFGSRKILFTGSILSSVGMVSSSYAPNIGVLIGTFGFLLGTGSCMVYFSAMMTTWVVAYEKP
ncbi:monocarboxylate transporter 7-like [Exaiptasia diaphana]|uniref:Major facilitator superfamily (MFS) profile domain-containing protein n=1 Tax=Exaiptasia diaphana TaxID=2652724 RepID=A0A913XE19_EXADI|nr:monocarboxylate transporter 7-like [Exaiptasia diaphana]